MDSCSSGPGIKHSPRLTEFALDCIGFITIPNVSENFPVGPVFTTGFTPRRRTTILACDPRKRSRNVELCNAQLSISIMGCLTFILMGLWGSLVVRKRASVVSAFLS